MFDIPIGESWGIGQVLEVNGIRNLAWFRNLNGCWSLLVERSKFCYRSFEATLEPKNLTKSCNICVGSSWRCCTNADWGSQLPEGSEADISQIGGIYGLL